MSAALPSTAVMLHRFGLGVQVAAASDGLRSNLSAARIARCGRIMIGAMAASLPSRSPANDETWQLDPEQAFPLAAALWPRLSRGSVTLKQIVAVNAALVLLADHGLAASTFAGVPTLPAS